MSVFHFHKHFQDVFPLLTGMLALSTVKLSKFNVHPVQRKIKDFQGPKTSFKYFQGLKIGLLKFKAFQDAYKPCLYIIIFDKRA